MFVTAFSQFIFTHKNELSILTAGAMPIVAVLWQGSSTESELKKEITVVKKDLSKKVDDTEERLMKEIHHTHAVAIGSTLIPITNPTKRLAMHAEILKLDQCLRSGGKDCFEGK